MELEPMYVDHLHVYLCLHLQLYSVSISVLARLDARAARAGPVAPARMLQPGFFAGCMSYLCLHCCMSGTSGRHFRSHDTLDVWNDKGAKMGTPEQGTPGI